MMRQLTRVIFLRLLSVWVTHATSASSLATSPSSSSFCEWPSDASDSDHGRDDSRLAVYRELAIEIDDEPSVRCDELRTAT